MSLADYAAQNNLSRVGARPPLRTYLVQVWRRREFIYSLAKFRIESENQRNRLGMLWVVLKPLLEAGVYGLIFGLLIGRGGIEHFVEFLIIGVFLYGFFSSCFISGAKSITSNMALVQSLSFPRMSLPLALVVQRLLQFAPMILIMMVLVALGGTKPSLQWLLLLPLTVIFFVFNAGLTLITARLTVHFRDLAEILPFGARLLFYTSGIFFSIQDRLGDYPTLMRISDFQPIHEFLTLGRAVLLDGPGYQMPMDYWLYATIWSFGLFAFGVIFFWAAEERYGRTH